MSKQITTIKKAVSDGRTSVKILITAEAGQLDVKPGDFVVVTIRKAVTE